MLVDIRKTLRTALKQLNLEKARMEGQIAALDGALEGTNRRGRARRGPARRTRKRRRMSAASRKAVGQRMKAYWAKRKAEATREKGKGGP